MNRLRKEKQEQMKRAQMAAKRLAESKSEGSWFVTQTESDSYSVASGGSAKSVKSAASASSRGRGRGSGSVMSKAERLKAQIKALADKDAESRLKQQQSQALQHALRDKRQQQQMAASLMSSSSCKGKLKASKHAPTKSSNEFGPPVARLSPAKKTKKPQTLKKLSSGKKKASGLPATDAVSPKQKVVYVFGQRSVVENHSVDKKTLQDTLDTGLLLILMFPCFLFVKPLSDCFPQYPPRSLEDNREVSKTQNLSNSCGLQFSPRETTSTSSANP